MTDKTEETTIPTFLSWLRSHGTTRLENVAWKTEDGSNERPSCFAAQSIPPHSPIMSIPSSLVLTEFDAAMSPPGRAVMAFLESREHVNDPLPVPSRRRILILPFLVYERFVRPPGESRFWHYLDLLPPKYEDPLWWTEEERKRELSGTNVLAYAESREELLKKDWEVARRVCSDAFGKDGLTWHNFLWAHSALYSRCFPSLHSPLTTGDTPPFTIPFDTVPTFDLADLSRVSSCGMALLPGLDMLNHGVGVEVVWKTTQGDDGNDNSHNADIPRDVPCVSFFTSSQPVDEGVPLLNNYGPKGNEELLMGYGFVVESSPDDYVRVRMAVRGLADTSAGVTNEILRRRLRVLHLLDPPRDGDGTVVTAPQVPSSGVELLDSSSSRPTFLHHLRARDPVPRSLMVQASVFTATESELSLLERRGGGEGEWDPTREPVTKRNVLASLAQVRTLLNGKHAALWTVHDQARAWWEHANSERAHDRDWVGKLGRDLRAGQLFILEEALSRCTTLAREFLSTEVHGNAPLCITLSTALSDPRFTKSVNRASRSGVELDETATLAGYLAATPELRARLRALHSDGLGSDALDEEEQGLAKESWTNVWSPVLTADFKKRKRKMKETVDDTAIAPADVISEDDFVTAWKSVVGGVEVDQVWWEQVTSMSDFEERHDDIDVADGGEEGPESKLVVVL